MSIEGQRHFFSIYFPGLYVLCFTRPRYQVSVYRTTGPLVVSSPEPLGSQGELIVYPSSQRPSVGVHPPFLAHLSRRLKGELIVYRSIRACVSASVSASVRLWVNIFKLEYLRNQWANRIQILSEASLGWGIDCIRFWTR